jgi:hypothetical protein
MTQPSDTDIANAETRAAVAARQNEEYGQAVALALSALGPGYTPWMKLSLIPSDHRETGDNTPVATVFKVYRGEERLTENSVFLRRMPSGTIVKARRYEDLFGELLEEKYPTKTVEVRGERVPVGRYELVWGALETYHPRSAEELAAARARREEKAVERAAEENPLFSEQIRAEGYVPKRSR